MAAERPLAERWCSPKVQVVLGGWVCSVVALVVRNAEQASQTRTTRTFICSDVLMRTKAVTGSDRNTSLYNPPFRLK